MNVAILYGGESGEHEISCISALSVYKRIDRKLYFPILIGITQNGCWYLQNSISDNSLLTMDKLPINEENSNLIYAILGKGFFMNGTQIDIDFVFPVLHGTYGEDGTVQGLLELMHLPYAGSNVVGSAVGMDKIVAKRVWKSCGIPVVPFTEMTHKDYSNKEKLQFQLVNIIEELSLPLFVKPVNAGSSVGANKANTLEELSCALEDAFKYDTRVLIEECVNPREIECAVIGNEYPEAFSPGEIIPTHEFYDFDAKYNDPNGAKLHLSVNLPEKTISYIIDLAKKAYTSIQAEGFARVDFFIDKNSNKIYLNEINTLPGFTHISMFPKMCEKAGIPYSDLITKIIIFGLERHKRQLTRNAILNKS